MLLAEQRWYTGPEMENVNSFTQAYFFNPKFYPEAQKLRLNENFDKTANNTNNTIFMNIPPSFLFGIQK